MKTIHVIMTQDKKIWVLGSPSEVNYFLNGQKAKCKISRSADFLARFLKENPDVQNYFLKGIGYWIGCEFFKKKEKAGQYGMLKRKLKNFGRKDENLLKGVKSEAKKIAKNLQGKLQHTEDPKPRYVRKTRVHSRPRV